MNNKQLTHIKVANNSDTSSYSTADILESIKPLLPYLLASAAGSLSLSLASQNPKSRKQNILLGALAGPVALAGSQLLLSTLRNYFYPETAGETEEENAILGRYYDPNKEFRPIDTLYRVITSPFRKAPILTSGIGATAALIHGLSRHWPEAIERHFIVNRFPHVGQSYRTTLSAANVFERLFGGDPSLPSARLALSRMPANVTEQQIEQELQQLNQSLAPRRRRNNQQGQGNQPRSRRNQRGGQGGGAQGGGARGGGAQGGGAQGGGAQGGGQNAPFQLSAPVNRAVGIMASRDALRRLPWHRIAGGAAGTAIVLYLLGKLLPSRLFSRKDEAPTGLDIAFKLFS